MDNFKEHYKTIESSCDELTEMLTNYIDQADSDIKPRLQIVANPLLAAIDILKSANRTFEERLNKFILAQNDIEPKN